MYKGRRVKVKGKVWRMRRGRSIKRRRMVNGKEGEGTQDEKGKVYKEKKGKVKGVIRGM